MSSPESFWVDDVLSFWFRDLTPSQWFKKDVAVDRAIRDHFGQLPAIVAALPKPMLLYDADTALAALITLDQFPRNLHRDSAQAFAYDATALALAVEAVDADLDQQCDKERRLFFYLPFEHSEDRAMQIQSLALISELGDVDLMRYAEAHKVIIDRFGRFPHRNAVLGRVTTDEEAEFLKQPMSSF